VHAPLGIIRQKPLRRMRQPKRRRYASRLQPRIRFQPRRLRILRRLHRPRSPRHRHRLSLPLHQLNPNPHRRLSGTLFYRRRMKRHWRLPPHRQGFPLRSLRADGNQGLTLGCVARWKTHRTGDGNSSSMFRLAGQGRLRRHSSYSVTAATRVLRNSRRERALPHTPTGMVGLC
jgi:hypothetical protein